MQAEIGVLPGGGFRFERGELRLRLAHGGQQRGGEIGRGDVVDGHGLDRIDEGGEHAGDGGHQLRRGGVAAFYGQHIRQFGVEIDPGRITERRCGAAQQRNLVSCVARGLLVGGLKPTDGRIGEIGDRIRRRQSGARREAHRRLQGRHHLL